MRNDKIRELLQSSNKAERVLGVQMICQIPFEDAVHTLYGFDMASWVREITAYLTPNMILHACFEIRNLGEKSFCYLHLTSNHPNLMQYLNGGIYISPKKTPWLCLQDIESLGLFREMIEPFGIESSIDDWETNYNSGQI